MMTKQHRGVAVLVRGVFLLVFASTAMGQITSPAVSTSGSSCTDGNATDRFCGYSAAIELTDATHLSTRYSWNINADAALAASAVQGGTAKHTVTFDVTAPGGYRLDVTTKRRGDLNILSDAACLPSTADIGAVTGASNVGVASGTLDMSDPSSLVAADTANAVIDQVVTAAIFAVSNGSPQSHQLDFTWTGSIVSESCEAAVRLGAQNVSTLNCAGCEYPGSPVRTLADDGHLVEVTLVSLCGNGVIDAEVNEDCDFGAGNGSATSCCTASCTLRTAGETCRPVAGPCDVEETCPGDDATCPVDGFADPSTLCRPAADVCDIADFCSGTAAACSVDTVVVVGTPCRASAGVCDIPEQCDGTPLCPTDAKSTAVCRAATDVCDATENCDGIGDDCPPDGLAQIKVVCRAATAPCDQPETCTGSGPTCPADVLWPEGHVCRPVDHACDLAETCDGSSLDCPPDVDTDTDADTVCDPVDVCPLAADGSQDDSDADGIGDACDQCTDMLGVVAKKPQLKLTKQDTPPGDDGLLLKGTLEGLPTTPPVDPVTHGMHVMLQDSGDGTVVDALIPGGAGWKANKKGTALSWTGAPIGGIQKIALKRSSSRPDRVKFLITGSNGTFAVPPALLPVNGTLIFTTALANAGECGEVRFGGCTLKGKNLICR
jgi:hypothetical protein